MARRRVAPENRIRAAQACENCKRRKQKCNGTIPCANCSKRQVQCFFEGPVPATGTVPAVSNTAPEQRKNSKKRKLDDLSTPDINGAHPSEEIQQQVTTPDVVHDGRSGRGASFPANTSHPPEQVAGVPESIAHHSPLQHQQYQQQQEQSRDSLLVMNTSAGTPAQNDQPADDDASDATDEAEIQGMSRMLDDGKGRMLYIGDAAPLSYLQTIRQLVSSVMGTSMFTVDPHRHNILEASMQAQPTTFQYAFTLPDREAALFLVDSFFINTKGMLHLFDEQIFRQRVERTYQNPLAADQSWMCILYLVFAVGLQLRSSSPQPSAKEAAILKRLLSDNVDRSEMFFLGARHLKDSASGIEDGDFASIQALLLMTLYMLSVGKRNTAWAYIGMAVRLAYALGLHRAETQRVYDETERTSMSLPRVLLWRSLYVMDRFLASCLGRPTAIQDEEISEELFPTKERLISATPGFIENFEFEALFASVRAAQILGTILHQIYRSRKVSLRIARTIAVQIHEWTQSLPEILQWRPTPMPHDDPGKAMGQLHVWMTYFSTIILLTRPFLLLHVKKIISKQQQRPKPSAHKSPTSSEPVASSPGEIRVADNPELNKYSAACVRSATHLIRAVQTIRVKGCLPRRNPFIINWMFIAALVVLTNSFFNVYENPENDSIAQTAIYLHQHFAECDPLAARYLQILRSFLKTIADRRSMNGLLGTMPKEFAVKDPIEDLFSGKATPQHQHQQISNTMLPPHQFSTSTTTTPQMPAWDWSATTTTSIQPQISASRDVLPDMPAGLEIPNNAAAGAADGYNNHQFGDNVEGLVFPGAEELLGPDPGPILEEVIHFDMLWPLNQDGLYSGNIPMYGMDNFL